jgi:menaquinol-cytochrome c reductase iron-sulfur subunit
VSDDVNTSRRGALRVLAVGGVVGCGALAVPTIRFVLAPAVGGSGAGRWVKTVPLDSLMEGEPKRVALVSDHRDAWMLEKQVELGAAWLERRGAGVFAWSTVCPHLGCAVDRKPCGSGLLLSLPRFVLRRGGWSASTGHRREGSTSLAVRLDDGFVHVEFRRFRQGTP